MLLTGAQIIAKELARQGVEVVFGYPGGQVLHIYDALYQAAPRIPHVLTCHEQGAAHAADGYARATGKTGVVIATSGPGATNLVTGIASAYLDSSPMVAITGNVPTNLLGRDSFQEVDITGVTMPVTKHNYIVKDVRELAKTLREAFEIAAEGRPGPVLIDVPKDVQLASAVYEEAPFPPAPEKVAFAIPDEIAALFDKAERPFIYAGGGVVRSGAEKELAALADALDAPVGFSMMGLSAMPAEHPRNLGLTGMHGGACAGKVKAEADLIVAVGVRFSDRATGNKAEYAKAAKVVHIDIDPAEINKNIPVYKAVVGNIPDVLAALLARLQPRPRPRWQETIQKYMGECALPPVGEELSPRAIIDCVSRHAGPDFPVATDVGQHQMWAAQYYPFRTPRTLITSGGLGAMGFGMGAAIGACIGAKKPCVLFTGDGSFHMNLNEMATAVTQKLPLRIFLMNNGVLGMVRQWQTLFFGQRYAETTLERKTDYALLAKAFGAKGLVLDNPADMERVVAEAFATDGPVLVDCRIDKDEKVLPMIPPGGTIKDIILR